MFQSILVAIALSITVASISPASASVDDLLDGIVALEACDQTKEMYDELKCDAFIVGIVSTFAWQNVYQKIELPYCIPTRRVVRLVDYQGIFVNWMNRNAAQLHGNSIGLFVKSMKATFPCKP